MPPASYIPHVKGRESLSFTWFVASPLSTGHSMVARQTFPFKRDEAAASYIPRVKGRESPHVGLR